MSQNLKDWCLYFSKTHKYLYGNMFEYMNGVFLTTKIFIWKYTLMILAYIYEILNPYHQFSEMLK